MKYIFFVICICPFFFACKNTLTDNNNTHVAKSFNRNDFIRTVSLKSSQKIEISEALNPYYCYLVKDSLVLLTNRDNVQEYKAGIYSPVLRNRDSDGDGIIDPEAYHARKKQ